MQDAIQNAGTDFDFRGFGETVIDVVSPIDFVNYTATVAMSDETVHVIPGPEGRGVAFLRIVARGDGLSGDFERVATILPDARFRSLGDEPWGEGVPEAITYHYTDAMTILTWLRSLARERSDASVSLDYWQANDTGRDERMGLHTESLIFSYHVSGREQIVAVNNQWENHLQMDASF